MGLQGKPALPNRPGNMRMAIYSLHHQPIGKSTQARPHTSAAHVRYITRPSAASRIEARRMPETPGRAAAYMRKVEDTDRKNARVSDKLMLALPRELDDEQRAQLVRDFAEDATQGRAPWLAAFHDQGKDTLNPHAHLVIRDRDPATGRRVAGLSEKGSTEWLRTLWETHTNRALEKAGRPERIDRRTLEAQGITREPTVHEGPKVQQMDRRGARPESWMRRYRNRPGSHLPYRDVDYRGLDAGRSRTDYNRQVRRPETPADYWDAVDSDNRRRELDQLRQVHHRPAELIDFPLVSRDVKQPIRRVDNMGPGVGAGRGLAQPEAHQQGLRFPVHPEPEAHPLEAHPFQERQRGRHRRGHDLIYGDVPGKGKEKMAKREDDDSPEAKWKANDAKQRELGGTFDHLLNNSYDDKDAAMESMGKFRKDHGTDGLFHALRTEPHTFGELPKDPAKAADAPRFRGELAPTFHALRGARDEGDRLNHLHGPRPDRGPGMKDVTPGAKPESGLDNLFNSRSSPAVGNQKLQPSSYPLESPFRAEQRPKLEQGGQPKSLSTPDDVHNPWEHLPANHPLAMPKATPAAGKEGPSSANPARHPLSLKSPPVGKGLGSAEPKAPVQSPEVGRHPLSRQSPALTKPQLTPAGTALPTAPQQALSQNPLQTPVQQQPIKQPRRGLDEGR
jgi:MobA/MobL family